MVDKYKLLYRTVVDDRTKLKRILHGRKYAGYENIFKLVSEDFGRFYDQKYATLGHEEIVITNLRDKNYAGYAEAEITDTVGSIYKDFRFGNKINIYIRGEFVAMGTIEHAASLVECPLS